MRRNPIRAAWWLLVALHFQAAPLAAETDAAEIRALKAQLDEIVRQNEAMRATLRGLEDEVTAARDDAQSAREQLDALPPPDADLPRLGGDALLSAPAGGGAQFQLLDVSVDVLWAAGGSSATDEELELLQGGNHDPRQRGFSVPMVELSMLGAVDPYFTGEVHLIYFIDTEGESRFELEEAFATTQQLPFGLAERGLQLDIGTFFTQFGRLNATHAHAWDWQDQPVVLTRFFGEDGMRGPGVSASWLLPLDWFSELRAGAQTAKGETMQSFLASDEAFEERPIGGRPFASSGTRSFADLAYHLRWVNGFDLSDTLSTQFGFSGLYGPNATGGAGETWIYGFDFVLKWIPLVSDRGWPFFRVEGEIMRRDYEADAFFGCPEPEDCSDPLSIGSERLGDWGLYLQALYGFRRGWAAGLRYEFATGSGDSIGRFDGRASDPFRDDRQRISPLLVFYPSEFSRIRLQYNYDLADHLEGGTSRHTLWLGLEFMIGSHPAHSY